MNNEPVAWMELYYGEPNNIAWTNTELKDSGEIYKTVPLYTHPADLTDEEIKAIAIQHIEKRLDGDRFGYFDFARAILRKAQEKC